MNIDNLGEVSSPVPQAADPSMRELTHLLLSYAGLSRQEAADICDLSRSSLDNYLVGEPMRGEPYRVPAALLSHFVGLELLDAYAKSYCEQQAQRKAFSTYPLQRRTRTIEPDSATALFLNWTIGSLSSILDSRTTTHVELTRRLLVYDHGIRAAAFQMLQVARRADDEADPKSCESGDERSVPQTNSPKSLESPLRRLIAVSISAEGLDHNEVRRKMSHPAVLARALTDQGIQCSYSTTRNWIAGRTACPNKAVIALTRLVDGPRVPDTLLRFRAARLCTAQYKPSLPYALGPNDVPQLSLVARLASGVLRSLPGPRYDLYELMFRGITDATSPFIFAGMRQLLGPGCKDLDRELELLSSAQGLKAVYPTLAATSQGEVPTLAEERFRSLEWSGTPQDLILEVLRAEPPSRNRLQTEATPRTHPEAAAQQDVCTGPHIS